MEVRGGKKFSGWGDTLEKKVGGWGATSASVTPPPLSSPVLQIVPILQWPVAT